MTLTPPPSGELVRGWMDVPLNREGENVAARVARDLKGTNLAFLITSDLDRAEETAETIEKIAHIPILQKTKALRTWGLGELEGTPLKGAEDLIAYYSTRAANEKPKGGESFNQFKRRVLSIIQDGLESDVPIGFITHHWPQLLITRWIRDGAKSDLSLDARGLFDEQEDPPGTVLDVIQHTDHHVTIKKVDPAKVTSFATGPVIIRHATTAWNAKGKG